MKYLYQDIDVELVFNVSVYLTGQQLPGASPPHFSVEFKLSDQEDIAASGSFNGGNGAVTVNNHNSVDFNSETLEGNTVIITFNFVLYN